jgi:hypothetical protein
MKEALRSEGFQGITGGLQNVGGMMMAAGYGPDAFIGKNAGAQAGQAASTGTRLAMPNPFAQFMTNPYDYMSMNPRTFKKQ